MAKTPRDPGAGRRSRPLHLGPGAGPRSRRLLLGAIGALLLVAGGALAAFGVTRKPTGGLTPQASEAMGSSIAQLDGDVKAARASVKERAATFASILAVQAAVSTDAATAKDMLVRGELQFSPQPGEVIELGQIKGGAPETLLIQPAGGMHSPHAGKAGSFADLMDSKVVITEVVQVTPKQNADQLGGYVMVVRPLDLQPALDRLVAAGVTGSISTVSGRRGFGMPIPNATEQEQSIPSLPDAKFVVSVPRKTGGVAMPLVAGGGGVAAVGLILLVLALIAKPSGAALQQIATARTQIGTTGGLAVAATGTPSPVSASDLGPGAPASQIGVPGTLVPGAALGRWEIIKRLGSGGMADVYLARAKGEAGFEKTVAVKVMHPHLARNQRAVEHFLDEARLAARITHPNVVAIQDLGKIGNDYVIVMEYVEGIDLERVLASARAGQRPVPLAVGLGILCRICDGLNGAHNATAADSTQLGIVHRDVKAANVLVSRQGGVKVVDFGIAKAAQQGHDTIAGETKGTPSYMAPEQRVGEPVDVRADVYSVAAVGYEILSGQAVNLDLAALAHLGVEKWPHLPPPSSLNPQVPHELDRVLLQAMSFERDKRPGDCAVFEASLETIMKQYNLSASDKDIARWVTGELAQLSSQQPEAFSPTAAT